VKVDSATVLDRLAERIERLVGAPAIDGEVSEAEAPSANDGQVTAEIRQFPAGHPNQPTSWPTSPPPEEAA
jgi:hypothetical protein